MVIAAWTAPAAISTRSGLSFGFRMKIAVLAATVSQTDSFPDEDSNTVKAPEMSSPVAIGAKLR